MTLLFYFLKDMLGLKSNKRQERCYIVDSIPCQNQFDIVVVCLAIYTQDINRCWLEDQWDVK